MIDIAKITCQYCGIVDRPHDCPKKIKSKIKRTSKYNRDKEIYWSNEWIETREEIREEQNNIDLFSYYVVGVIKQVECVHHIVLINNDYDLVFNINNLIGVSFNSHKCIHELYKINMSKVQDILYECKKLFNEGIRLNDRGKLKYLIDDELIDIFDIYCSYENNPPHYISDFY